MLIRFFPAQESAAEPSVAAGPSADQPPPSRRGVTSMEYLVMISFILLAIILTVQSIGAVTSGLLRNSADATEKTNSP